MAKDVESVGSDRGELKKLLKLAKAQPIHMAFATDADGKMVVQMHKMKPPRTLEKGLKEGLDGGKNHRFGTVVVDPDDPKLVKFIVNKAIGGAARKMVIALKGTGFKKIQIVTESGEALEEAVSDDDEEDEDEDETPVRPSFVQPDNDEDATSRRAPPDDEITPVAREEPEQEQEEPSRLDADSEPNDKGQEDSPDAESLKKELTGLVKDMLGVIRKQPSAKDALAELATDAQVNLKRGDLEEAAAGIEILRTAIDSYSGDDAEPDADSGNEKQAGAETEVEEEPTPPEGGKSNGKANGKSGPASVQTFHKSRVAWTATRAKVDTELQKLSKAIMDASAGEDMIDGLEDQFFKVVDPVLAELDETLSDTLSAAADADGEEREQLLSDARKTIARYRKFVESSSIISDLDNNPFVPLAIGKTLTSTLSTLTSIMR